MSFTYDDNGIRTSKTVNGVTHTYYLNGSQITAEQWEDKLLVYLYDASGSPIGMMYRTTSYDIDEWDTFFFEKNLQGDIVTVYNSDGAACITYKYDAWGNFKESYIGNSPNAAWRNPFRYRGYYYDTDLGMYYLQSRYYDPNICRFINADGYVSTGQGLIGYNMFAYCGNNPVMGYDPTGHWDWGGVVAGLILAVAGGVAAYFGSMTTEVGAQITLAVISTGLTMITAAATDSQMVMDVSSSITILGEPVGNYLKCGGTILIDFNADEAYLYGHGGSGGGRSWGMSGNITYGTGLVWNYDSPDDFERTFIDLYVGGVVGLEYGVSPKDFFGAPTQSLCITFSGMKPNSVSVGAGVDYYFPPVKLFDW